MEPLQADLFEQDSDAAFIERWRLLESPSPHKSAPVLTDAQILAIGTFGQSPLKRLDHGRAIERAAVEAHLMRLAGEEAHFDLLQDDMIVASVSGPRAAALAEIQHYAVVYGQDGPVRAEEVIRIPILTPAPPPEQKT